MQLKPAGKNTSQIEVLNISLHGFWLLINDEEYLLPFSDFPWFSQAKIEDILNVELIQGEHIFWPNLDIDLNVDMIKHPDKYPLIAKSLH